MKGSNGPLARRIRIAALTVSATLLAVMGAGPAAAITLPLLDCEERSLFLSRTPPEGGRDGFDFLKSVGPVIGPAKQIDSPGLRRAKGNPWKEIGVGWFVALEDVNCVLNGAGPLALWVGLTNSDDQGARFDLRAELQSLEEFPAPVASGEVRCLSGVVRAAGRAKLALIPLDVTPGVNVKGETLTLRIFARMGTAAAGSCPGHASAGGLRLYYDESRLASGFVVKLAEAEAP